MPTVGKLTAPLATPLDVFSVEIGRALDELRVAGILLAIDSPGGPIAGVAELAQQIRMSCRRKPITAIVTGQCAGSALWLATAAQRVLAAPDAKIGGPGEGGAVQCVNRWYAAIAEQRKGQPGIKAVLDRLYDGETVDAAAALAGGLVDELCDYPTALARLSPAGRGKGKRKKTDAPHPGV